jgi:hypothetical protein
MGADYDNNSTQTTGFFRDVLGAASINQGSDLGGTGHSALNFSGSSNNAAYAGSMTLYDTSPGNSGSKNLFTGNLSVNADILTSTFDNSKGPGILFLYNEGSGLEGLALSVFNGGGTDNNQLRLVNQTGEKNSTSPLASQTLSGAIAESQWYRLELDLTFSGANYTVAGRVFNHQDVTDPNSAIANQIGSQLNHTSTLSGTISTPYEIGLVARNSNGTINSSVTNFNVTGNQLGTAVPEPGTFALMGIAALGFASLRRRKVKGTSNSL